MAALSNLWLRLRGDYSAIADGYYRDGKLRRAAQLYARAGNYEDAARLSARAGDEEQAVSWLAHLKDPLKAGELLAAEGLDKLAVSYLEEGGAFWRAGECSLRSKQPLRAAHLFERGSAFEKAAECYELAGDTEGVLRVLKRQSEKYDREREDANRRRTDLRRAKILSKLGRFGDAALILESCGRPLLAAELWQKSGNAKRAVRAYLDGGSPQRAAALLDQVGDLGSLERAELLSAVSKHDEAAKAYDQAGETSLAIEEWEAAGDFVKAAGLLEKTGQYDRAADLYYRGGGYEEAARCFLQAGELRSSAQALSQSGDHRAAARRFLEADEPLQAAREFIKGEEPESARSALRSVEADSHEHESAVLLLVPLLVDAGDHGEALDRLDTLSPSQEPSSIAAKSYWQGRANEGLGDFARASSAPISAPSISTTTSSTAQARLDEMRRRMQQGVDVSPLATQEIGVSVVELGPGALLEGRFEIVAEIGRGGMSRVYRAYDRERGETLAVKVLLPRFEDTNKGESRLLNEVRISRKLKHPNIVSVYDFGRFPGGIFVTMELIEGRTLDRVLKEGRPTRCLEDQGVAGGRPVRAAGGPRDQHPPSRSQAGQCRGDVDPGQADWTLGSRAPSTPKTA